MRVMTSITDMQRCSTEIKQSGQTIGYVPTMGYLHEGHLQLVQEAKKQDEVIVMSIFVNPLQFGPNEDFDRYPRDFGRDEQLAEQAGVDIIFYPSQNEMYPAQLVNTIHVGKGTGILCGKSRPGHFDGVVTVLTKLFNIILPDRAYFGMKDAQQVAIVTRMVSDFNIPVQIVPVPIVREADGLAKSSRNVNLTDEERLQASVLYTSLRQVKTEIENGERNAETIKNMIKQMIIRQSSGQVDYVEICSYPDLVALTQVTGNVLIALAVQFSKVRLIDNLTLTVDKKGDAHECFVQ